MAVRCVRRRKSSAGRWPVRLSSFTRRSASATRVAALGVIDFGEAEGEFDVFLERHTRQKMKD